jgi:multidrug efflux pump subunit AcrA (membrane-fusion protein)
MTDLTASKPLDHSADEADVDPQGVTDGERAVEYTEVVLLPGMTATVDVVSGKRTVLDYIWEPVSKVKELALRD